MVTKEVLMEFVQQIKEEFGFKSSTCRNLLSSYPKLVWAINICSGDAHFF